MNLIIVTTPLQVLIAERIISEHPHEQFDALVLVKVDNDKYRYYTERLRAVCHQVKDLLLSYPATRWGKLRQVLQHLSMGIRMRRYQSIYCASIDMNLVQTIVACQRKTAVYTFDDGLVNLDPPAWAEVMKDLPNGFMKLARRLFHIPTMHQLIERSQRHYTIYRLPNVMPRTHYIPLIRACSEQGRPIEQSKRILLGQHLYKGQSPSLSEQLIHRVAKEFEIDQYIPHPTFGQGILGAKEVQTPLIFEDYILQELQQNPTTHYEVYLFSSTPSINLAGVHPRLSFVSIKPEDAPEMFAETYRVIAEAGIPVLPYPATAE